MITFITSIILLILGYLIYGKFVEKYFGIDTNNKTPAFTSRDDVDYMPLPTWKVYMIEFLNIAGLGPIFGAILGAMYGQIAYIWIVVGCIFMGATHDFFSGMLSIRNNGASLPELVSKYLGNKVGFFLRILTLLLLIFVGVAFVTGPAGLLHDLTGTNQNMWLYIIFFYYIIATLLPINKIIGKIYPVFGAALLLMALLVGSAMVYYAVKGTLTMDELSLDLLSNQHMASSTNYIVPMLFIVISCGAISGFHATQTPLMARCLKNERMARPVFYGAMISEGIVALIWATAAMTFFGGPEGLNNTIAAGHNPAYIVNIICHTWLGKVGAILAIIGVVACPITTGDTAFRSARLTIADIFKIDQSSMTKRLWISIPLFALGYALSQFNFSTIWKYLGITNQILACVVLWMSANYLKQIGKRHWMMSIPALFLTFICGMYILTAPNSNGGLAIEQLTGGTIAAICSLILFIYFIFINTHKNCLQTSKISRERNSTRPSDDLQN